MAQGSGPKKVKNDTELSDDSDQLIIRPLYDKKIILLIIVS